MSKYSCLLAAACLSEMKMRLLPKISRILGPHDLLSPDGGKQLRVAGSGGGGGRGLKCRIIEKRNLCVEPEKSSLRSCSSYLRDGSRFSSIDYHMQTIKKAAMI